MKVTILINIHKENLSSYLLNQIDMPHLDHTGPENKGPKTGRKLGKCKKDEESKYKLGEGMGSKRKSQNDCEGKGKRLKSGQIFNKHNK